jgi:hypothetical protein
MSCVHIVVVDDLNLERVAIAPDETNAPLVIDPDAVLTSAIAGQCFQAVVRRCP